jgi:serine/threonine protein kinase
MSDWVGKTIHERYQVLEHLGRGGLAVIYRAYDLKLDRYVAIKALSEHLRHDQNFVSRFQRESEALTRLHHPNIMSLVEVGEEQDAPYMVMEYLSGDSLEHKLQGLNGRPMLLAEAISIAAQVASALEHAHAQGIVHLDIKPTNILLVEYGRVLLMDFGMSNAVGGEQTNALLGTPAYMAPEQAFGGKADHRSDIYSLGVVFYQMVTGRVPFEADTPLAVILKHLQEPLPLPRQFNPNLPEDVERILLKTLSKKPENRYQTAREMAEALNRSIAPGAGLAEQVDAVALRQVLAERFDLEELRTVCFDLGVRFDDLPAEGQQAKARELVAYLQRRERLSQLVSYIRQHRPDIKL